MKDEPLTWAKFTTTVEDYLGSGWLFRGHSRDWLLETTLERHRPPTMSGRLAEQRLTYEFRRRIHEYIPEGKLPRTLGELVATMQHFGAPTRLLDVTRSPFVAAYFAFENAGDQDRIVWAFHGPDLVRLAGSVYLKDGIVSSKDAAERLDLFQKQAPTHTFDIESVAGVMGSQADTEQWFDLSVPVVVPYEPVKLSERLSVQQGLFLVPRDLDRSFLDNLKGMAPLDKISARRFVLKADQRELVLERLRLMNITRATLFPGLDGFAQSFRQILMEESPESRVARFDERRRREEMEARSLAAGNDQSEKGT